MAPRPTYKQIWEAAESADAEAAMTAFVGAVYKQLGLPAPSVYEVAGVLGKAVDTMANAITIKFDRAEGKKV